MKQFFNEQLAGGKIGEGGKRIEWLDTLRVFACFLVVLTHSAMSGDESDGVYLAMVSFIGSPSSELFFTVSGAILLPVKTDFRSFYRKRFGKLYPPRYILVINMHTCVCEYWKRINSRRTCIAA